MSLRGCCCEGADTRLMDPPFCCLASHSSSTCPASCRGSAKSSEKQADVVGRLHEESLFKQQAGLMAIHQCEHLAHQRGRLTIAEAVHVQKAGGAITATEPQSAEQQRLEVLVFANCGWILQVRQQSSGSLLTGGPNHVKVAGGVRDDFAELNLGLNMGEPHLRQYRPENRQFQGHSVLLDGLGIEDFGGVHSQDPKYDRTHGVTTLARQAG